MNRISTFEYVYKPIVWPVILHDHQIIKGQIWATYPSMPLLNAKSTWEGINFQVGWNFDCYSNLTSEKKNQISHMVTAMDLITGSYFLILFS
jgi:hypothetical protein